MPSRGQSLKVVVGLGNPGKRYEWTRHNAGFLLVDFILAQAKNRRVLKCGTKPFEAVQLSIDNDQFVLAKPKLFMNESGQAVRKIVDHFSILLKDCLIVVDDVNLPLGTIRFRPKGSAGGHHGLESIIEILGTSDFPRLRIGVATGDLSGSDISGYVLERFSESEREQLLPQIQKASQACLEWVKNGPKTVSATIN